MVWRRVSVPLAQRGQRSQVQVTIVLRKPLEYNSLTHLANSDGRVECRFLRYDIVQRVLDASKSRTASRMLRFERTQNGLCMLR